MMRRVSSLAAALGAAPGAVLGIELRTSGRRRSTYIVRALYLGLMLAVVVLAVISTRDQRLGVGAAARLQAMSGVAPTMAIALGWVQYLVLTFMAPVLTAPAISDEKTKRTLPALAMTPLTAGQIVAGKLVGRMSQVFILALASVPALLFVRVFGGLPAEAVVGMTAVALTSALLSGSLGLFYALSAKTGRRAAGSALSSMAFLAMLPMLHAIALWGLTQTSPSMQAMEWWSRVNPFMAMMSISERLESPGSGMFPQDAWRWCAAAHLLASLLVCALTTVRLRAALRSATGGKPARTAEGRGASRKAKGRRSRAVWTRVVRWRELRGERLISSWQGWVGLFAVAAAIAVLYITGDPHREEFHIVPIVLASMLQLFLAAQAASGTIAGEREARTWETLITTSLTARQIIWQKYSAVGVRLAIIPALISAHILVFGLLGFIDPLGALHAPLSLYAFSLLLAATGVWFSLRHNKSITAAAWNLSCAMGVWIVGPFVVGILISLTPFQYTSPAWEWTAMFLGMTNPGFMELYAIINAVGGYSGAPFTEFGPIDNLTPVTFTALYAMHALVVVALAIGVLGLCVARFPRHGGRSG